MNTDAFGLLAFCKILTEQIRVNVHANNNYAHLLCTTNLFL